MSAAWIDFLVSENAQLAEACVLDFGDAQAERLAAEKGGIMADLSPRALLRVTGEDAESFLQGQLTCDLKALAPGESSFGAYCTPKGRMLASFLIIRVVDGFLLLLARDIATAVQKRLQMYVLRAKVKLEDMSGAGVLLGLQGERARQALSDAGYPAPEAAHRARAYDSLLVIALPGDRFILLCANEARAQQLWSAFKAFLRPVGFACWEWLAIVQGEPWLSAATQEEFIPQMTNLEIIGGVSFKKGCYPGQEVVARTQYLGKGHRRMYRAHSGAAVYAGDAIFADTMGEQACGKIVNAAPAPHSGWDLLAVVHGDALKGPVHAQTPSGPLLEFLSLPYAVDEAVE